MQLTRLVLNDDHQLFITYCVAVIEAFCSIFLFKNLLSETVHVLDFLNSAVKFLKNFENQSSSAKLSSHINPL